MQGRSPYEEKTYRYTPLIAWMLIPNRFFADFGKLEKSNIQNSFILKAGCFFRQLMFLLVGSKCLFWMYMKDNIQSVQYISYGSSTHSIQ
jgi:hypothetical protein